MRLLLLLLFALCCCHDTGLFAQDVKVGAHSKNSEGTEFWICFQRNYRDSDIDQTTRKRKQADPLTLELFLTSDVNSKVQIDIDGIDFHKEVNVRGGTVVNVKIDSAAQVRGSDRIERLAVHIVSDNPIGVYGLNRRFQTTDTYLALPVSVLGTEYRVMAYEKLSTDLVSQVAVIATEDATEVIITPQTTTMGGYPEGKPYKVLLRKGDVYQFRAAHDRKSAADLTGTLIKANKKIAVFSGHNCAYVPSGIRACNHLVEQIPPLQSWGRQFYVGTLAKRSSSTLRVLAMDSNTVVFENFKKVKVLQAGEYYQNLHLRKHTQITASKPVLVAQYAQGFQQNGDSIGDPMMILVSPTQQFLKHYRFATPVNGVWRHYINVVVPANAVASLRLNGNPVKQGSFERFGKSGYMIAQLQVPYGTHTIAADEPFGLYSYGFGFGDDAWDAYGNMAGQSFADVEFNPDTLAPAGEGIETAEEGMRIFFREERVDDRGMEKVRILASEGLEISLPDLEPGVPLAEVGIKPQSAGEFGRATLEATDLAGNSSIVTVCYTVQSGGAFGFVFAEGTAVDCAPGMQWYYGAFAHIALNNYSPSFGNSGNISTLGTFSESSAFGGIGGFMAGTKLSFDYGLSVRLGFDTYGGTILSPDSSTSRFRDNNGNLITVQEGRQLDLQNLYMNLAVQGEYYFSDRYYAALGLQASLALSKDVAVQQVIIAPSNFVYPETGSSEVTVYEGEMESLSAFRPALYAGFGTVHPVWKNISAFGEAQYILFLSDIIDDGDWGHTQLSFKLGARVAF